MKREKMTEMERLIWDLTVGIRASTECGPANEFTNKQLEMAVKGLAAALEARAADAPRKSEGAWGHKHR